MDIYESTVGMAVSSSQPIWPKVLTQCILTFLEWCRCSPLNSFFFLFARFQPISSSLNSTQSDRHGARWLAMATNQTAWWWLAANPHTPCFVKPSQVSLAW